MIGKIQIEFNTDTGQIMLNAPLDNQEQKDLTVKVLAASIPIAVAYEKSPILKPNGNGRPHIIPPIPKSN
jgi:hypothetical protein